MLLERDYFVCQVSFPKLLILEKEEPLAFHEKIRKTFMNYKKNEESSTEINLNAENYGDNNKVVNRKYEFYNEDKQIHINLRSDSIALFCKNEISNEEFNGLLKNILEILWAIYEIPFSNRVGVRSTYYEKLELISESEGYGPPKKVSRNILGFFPIEMEHKVAANRFIQELVKDDQVTRVITGLGYLNKEPAFVIDIDTFSLNEKKTIEEIIECKNQHTTNTDYILDLLVEG